MDDFSMDELDLLISEVRALNKDLDGTDGAGDIPDFTSAVEPEKAETGPEDFSFIDFDPTEIKAPEDVFSTSEPEELEGQEQLYADDEDDFDISSVVIETVEIPEQEFNDDEKFPGVRQVIDNLFTDEKTKTAEDIEKTKYFSIHEETPQDRAKTKTAPSAKSEPEEIHSDTVEGQMVMSGFVGYDEEQTPVKADEKDLEEKLEGTRKKLAREFQIETPDIGFDESQLNADDIVAEKPKKEKKEKKEKPKYTDKAPSLTEYRNVSERNTVVSALAKNASQKMQKAVTLGIIAAVLFLIGLLPALLEKLNVEASLFVSGSVVMGVLNIVLMGVAVALSYNSLLDGLISLTSGQVNGDGTVCLVCLVALIQGVYSLFTGGDALFCLIAVFAIMISALSEMLIAQRTLDNFNVLAYKYDNNLCSVAELKIEGEIFEIGRGVTKENPTIVYSSGVGFPTDFIRNSEKEAVGTKDTGSLLLWSFCASLLLAVVWGIKSKSLGDAVNSFACAFCVSSPILLRFIPAFAMYSANRKLNPDGSLVTSWDTADKVGLANAVVVDAGDIFDSDECTIHGMNSYKTMRMDDILLYAAAMVIKTGGPMKESFKKMIDGREDLMPAVKEPTYEDKLGISGRIMDQKVLLGNRSMLIHHNIIPPDEETENKYTQNGRKVIYLACNETVAAMFVLSYKGDDEIRPYLKTLEKNGVQVLIRTNDVNINEEFVAEIYSMNPATFKVLSSVGARLYNRRKDSIIEKEPAGVIHDGSSKTMLQSIASCIKLMNTKSSVVSLEIIALALGVAFSTLVSLLSLGSFAGVLGVVLVLITAAGAALTSA